MNTAVIYDHFNVLGSSIKFDRDDLKGYQIKNNTLLDSSSVLSILPQGSQWQRIVGLYNIRGGTFQSSYFIGLERIVQGEQRGPYPVGIYRFFDRLSIEEILAFTVELCDLFKNVSLHNVGYGILKYPLKLIDEYTYSILDWVMKRLNRGFTSEFQTSLLAGNSLGSTLSMLAKQYSKQQCLIGCSDTVFETLPIKYKIQKTFRLADKKYKSKMEVNSRPEK